MTCHVGDGALGLPEAAPFDAINVAAAGRAERLGTLTGQLAHGGRLVAPVERAGGDQVLVVLRRTEHERVRFVPLS